MTVWIVVLIVLGALVAAVLLVSWLLSTMVVQPKRWEYDACYEEEIRRGGFSREKYETVYRPEEVWIPSPHGYNLHALVFPKIESATFSDGRARVAVIAHGYSYTLFGSVKYADMFRDMGFTCVLYDEPNHGKSGRTPTTMGAREKDDLAAVCAWARSRFGQDCVLGTHGESMGAATVMLHAPTDGALAFAIEDCGYSRLSDQLAYNLKSIYHLPRVPFLPLGSLFSKLRGGVFFGRVIPAQAVAQCPEDLPMLFVHGESDTFVPTGMVYENYAAKRGVKQLETYPGAEHAQSLMSDRPRYRAMLERFLKEHSII